MVRKSGSQAYGTVTLLLIWVLALPLVVARDDSTTPSVDPFTDPQDDRNNPLRYITSNSLAAVGFGIFAFPDAQQRESTHSFPSALYLTVALSQTLLVWRTGGKFMLSMVIAVYGAFIFSSI